MKNELTVNAHNKIIDRDLLLEIIEAMHDELEKCSQIAKEEEAKNEPLQLQYQKWTLRYFKGSLRFSVFFKDNHDVTYDDYHTFLSVFKSRAFSIRHLIIDYTLSYNKPDEKNGYGEHMYNSINISATEDDFRVSSHMASGDKYMQEVYDLITQKIASAPPKYDHIIKAKELISLKIGFAMGLIPAIVVVTASAFIPQLHEFYNKFFFLFPALILLLALAFGFFLGSMKTSANYAKLVPKKYGGWDSNTHSSYYTDDLKKLTETSDILIGDKADHMLIRKKIAEDEKRFSKLILPFIGAAAIVSLIMFFVTR